MTTMDANELGRWTRFAARGGIGKCTAVEDCIAEAPEDLMFMKDDDIIVLMQVQDTEGRYLGYCEGIVGYFRGDHVRFRSKLKKAIMAKRSSVGSAKSPTPDAGATTPRSPPAKIPSLPPTTSRRASPHSAAATEDLGRSGSIDTERLPVHAVPPADASPASSSTLSSAGDSRTAFSSGQISAATSDTTPSPVGPSGVDGRGHSPTTLQRVASKSKITRRSAADPDDGAETVDPESTNDAGPSHDDTVSSSLFGLHERTYEYSDHDHRVSRALSEGKLGIGLSLLQDLVNGIGGDWSDTEEDGPSPAANPLIEADPPPGSRSRGNSVHHRSMAPASDAKYDITEPRRRASSSMPSSPSSIYPSHSDWEGASDIYDDYRYSRHSIASKLSRYSQNSGDYPNHSGSNAPPLPTDAWDSVERKQSTDSQWLDSIPSSETTGNTEASQGPTYSQNGPTALETSSATSAKDQVDFPLIQATFASPPTSPESRSSESTLVSPTLHLVSLPQTTPGPVLLRQESGSGRGSPIAPNALTQSSSEGEAESRRIVVEDKETGTPQKNPRKSSGSPSPELGTTLFPGPLRIVNRTPSPALSVANPPENEQVPERIGWDVYQTPSAPVAPAATASAPPPSSQPAPAPQGLPQSMPAAQNVPGSRRSLFLPHPNAPKPAPVPSEPMYVRRASRQPTYDPTRIMENSSAMHAVRMAASGQRGLASRTIYGRCDKDLANSHGPVPITFSLEPPAVSLPASQYSRSGNGSVVVNRPSTAPSIRPPAPSAEFGSIPLTSVSVPSLPERDVSAPASVTPSVSAQSVRPAPTTPVAKPVVVPPASSSETTSTGNVIPRPNFVPKIQTARPRSRSFSGFETAPLGTAPGEKFDEPVVKAHRSRTSSSSVAPPSKKQPFGGGAKTPASRIHTPSPLSLPQNNSAANVSTKDTLQSPTVPSPTSFSPLAPSFSSDKISMQPTIRHTQSSMALNEGSLLASRYRPTRTKHTSVDTDSSVSPTSTLSKQSFSASATALPLRSKTDSAGSIPARRSTDVNVSRNAETRSLVSSSIGVTTPSVSVGRTPSLKSKLSLPNLRGKNVGRVRQDDAWNMATGARGQDVVLDNETVQVKDMDFELIRPIIPRVSTSRSSEDSIGTAPSGSFDLKLDVAGNHLRADSPISMSSAGGSSLRSPTTSEGPWNRNTKGTDSETSMDAHRQRELKWVSVMSSVSPSQARKSKKVKKLLLEGVPSSVRFLVWAHLTDSKARGVPGVYSQLGQRVRVSAYQDVRRDVQRCFADQPQLLGTHESLVTLLSTYMTMVPDIPYHRGMAFVAAHLLLLSPEEDAFWIFVSMMDAHLRPYFSTSSVQMEVDALLFSKALEAHDPPLSKKIFFGLGVKPVSICKPWFGCVFAQTLPAEHLRRVWDLFLYEGLPFLFRVGLALITVCRRQLLHANSGEFILRHLRHPPVLAIPTDPEVFLSLVFAVKIKDDDIRKQRVKMESQIKRQTQQRMAQS